jgi:hypothetical protein
MRASPAFRIRIARYGVWRAAVATLLAVTLLAQAAWLAGHAGQAPLVASVMLAALDFVLLGAAAGALRQVPVDLRWDTQRWLLGPGSDATGPHPGNLTIALDLGAWMLLRFDHDAPPRGRRRTTWLPVQRLGLEAHWHALRCAVYCARPAPGTDAGPNSGAGPESQE